MNKKFLYILMVLVLVCSLALTACNVYPVKVTITYKYNYEGAPADKVVTVDKDANITLENPSRTGYTFGGWFTDAGCTKAFADKVATANVTLYAKWTAVHTHSLKYQYSAEKHWQECETCDYATAQEAHDTKGTDGACSVCGYKPTTADHNHVTSGTYASDATGHWVVCTCGNKVLSGAHDTNGTDGACSVCGYKAQSQEQNVTLYYYAADVESVTAYAWTYENEVTTEYLGTWPGTSATAVQGQAGWYSVEVSAQAKNVIFIYGGTQTGDLVVADGPYFYLNSGYATKELADEAIALPVVNPTLYYYNSGAWEKVYAYTWSPESLGTWPGTEATAVADADGWFSIEVAVGTINIIFSNNSGSQTADLLVADGPYFYANKGYATKELAEEAMKEPVVTTYTLKGSFDSWGAGVAFEAKSETEVQLLNYAMEANTEFKVVISVTGQNDEWINTLKTGVTVATLTDGGNITVAEAGNYNLYFDITTKELWIEKVVEPHTHTWATDWSSDGTHHWKACSGCEEVNEKEEHLPGAAATETTPQICTVCQKVLVQELGHVHALTKHDAVEATCTEAGNSAYWSCACGKYFSDEQGATEVVADSWVVPAKGHDFTNGDCACGQKEFKPAGDVVLMGIEGDWYVGTVMVANPGDTSEVMLMGVQIPAGAEIKCYIKATDTWIGYENLKTGIVVELSKAEGESDNIVVTNAGRYNLYLNIATSDKAKLWIEAAHEHVTSGAYEHDENGHWVVCSCQEKVLQGEHVPGAAATETTPQICTVCERVLVSATGHIHSWATDWSSDGTHHWKACSGCEEVNEKEEHNFSEGDCKCGAKAPLIVHYYNSQGWEAVKVHAWNDGGNVTGDWPGKDATAVEGEAGWFSVEIPAGATGLLFNSGTGSQTADLLVADGPYFYDNTGYATLDEAKAAINHVHDFTNGDCTCGEKAPLILYYYNSSAWGTVYAYTWTDSVNELGAWPGTAMTAVAGEEGWYSIEVPTGTANVIFHNNSGSQTADLLVADGPYFYDNTGYATLDEAKAAINHEHDFTNGDCTCGEKAPVTLYFYNADSWEEVRGYSWTPSTLGAWPGTVLEPIEEGSKWYSVVMDANVGGFQFNNGKTADEELKKTGDLTIEAGKAYYLGGTWYATQAEAEATLEHEHAYTVAGKDETHHWNQCECGEVDATSKVEHTYVEGVCSCGATEPVAEAKIVLFYYKANVEGVNAYTWTDSVNELGAWPGTAMTAVEGEDGWFTIEVVTSAVNLIFNWTGGQTLNLLVADGPYFYDNTGYATLDEAKAAINHVHDFTNGDCSCGETAPLPPVTLYFYNSYGWEAVSAHAWNDSGNVTGEWPGKPATLVDGQTNWFSVEIPATATKVIFNNNNNAAETATLVIDTTKTYCYAETWYATQAEAEAAMAQPVTVVYTLCGSFNNWEPNVILEEGETEGVVELLNQEFTARTEFKVVIYVNGTPEWINKLQDDTDATLVDPSNADSNLVVEPGTYSFYFNTETKEINVVLVAEHSHAYNVANKDATHHWNQCACGAVDEASKEAHDFTEGDCACGEKAPVEGESTKIYVDCSACSWFESDNAVLTVYLWNDTENNTWPGVVLTKVEGSNLYEIEWTGENPITGIIVCRWNPAQDTEWNRVEVSGFVFNAETSVFTFASDASTGTWSALPVAE